MTTVNRSFDEPEINEITDRLLDTLSEYYEIIPESTDDSHRIFVYFVAELFEGSAPDVVNITEGPNEHGMDFYLAEDDKFIAYQCKIPEYSTLDDRVKIHSFGKDAVNDIEDILTFLTDTEGTSKGNDSVEIARTKYREKKLAFESISVDSIYRIEVVLSIFGVLSINAKEYLDELIKNWSSNGNITIRLLDFYHITDELDISHLKPDRPEKIKIGFQKDTDITTLRYWGYALVPAIELRHIFEKYRMAIFDLNVRGYYKRSSVNKRIENSLRGTYGQKNFHLLNNGITIACSHFRKRGNSIWINNPQIINGCQTIISIYRAYNGLQSQDKQSFFRENCFVPAKIIATSDTQLLDQIVVSTNNQNKMASRNLQSNTRWQRVIQNKFDLLTPKWFYQRKDEEFASLKIYRPQGFRPQHYENRIIDNEELGKCWLSFIGCSYLASEKINAFERIEEKGNYEWLFERNPKDNHWESITLGPQIEFEDGNFENRPPESPQYLLSYLIYKFIRNYIISPQRNRKEAIERLMSSGTINESTPVEDINRQLTDDNEYIINQILNNMKEVILELYSLILIKKYGPINSETAKGILKKPGFFELSENPNFKKYIDDLETYSPAEKRKIILYTCFEFIKATIRKWSALNLPKYLAAQRRIRFLHDKKIIKSFKEIIYETNEDLLDEYAWKPGNTKYFESLEDI